MLSRNQTVRQKCWRSHYLCLCHYDFYILLRQSILNCKYLFVRKKLTFLRNILFGITSIIWYIVSKLVVSDIVLVQLLRYKNSNMSNKFEDLNTQRINIIGSCMKANYFCELKLKRDYLVHYHCQYTCTGGPLSLSVHVY